MMLHKTFQRFPVLAVTFVTDREKRRELFAFEARQRLAIGKVHTVYIGYFRMLFVYLFLCTLLLIRKHYHLTFMRYGPVVNNGQYRESKVRSLGLPVF